jgi:cytochrome c oxidase subunit 4
MTTEHHDDRHHGFAHVMSLRMLVGVFLTLIALTALTVFVAQADLGSWEIVITMLIATTKATLVAVYFMHLRYDSPFNAAILVFSLLFVALFIGFTLVDVERYQPDLIPPVNTVEVGVP